MTTLLVTENFPPKIGGSGRYLWEIYRRFPPGRVVVAAGEHPSGEAFDRTHDLRLVRMPLTLQNWGLRSLASLRGYWRAIRRLRRLVRSEGVTMLHCGRCLPEGLMGLCLRWWTGLPYCCYVYGEEMNYASSSRELSWLMRRVLRGAACAIGISRNTVRILEDEWHYPPGRIKLVYPGIDTNQYVPASRDAPMRASLGWDDRRVILTVGRLQKRKGHDRMIEALAAIRQTVPDVLYAIAGEGEERESLRQLVVEHGQEAHVQFLGEIDDQRLLHCYQQCDLFVLANRQVGQDIEGFGIVLLEAQACGKPVIAGASGGTAETMRDPDTGLVIPCEGPHELAARVAELLADPQRRARMGEAARQWVVENFDWSVLSRQAEAIFQDRSALEPALTG